MIHSKPSPPNVEDFFRVAWAYTPVFELVFSMTCVMRAFDFWGLDVYIKPVHGLFQVAISQRIDQKVFFEIY